MKNIQSSHQTVYIRSQDVASYIAIYNHDVYPKLSHWSRQRVSYRVLPVAKPRAKLLVWIAHKMLSYTYARLQINTIQATSQVLTSSNVGPVSHSWYIAISLTPCAKQISLIATRACCPQETKERKFAKCRRPHRISVVCQVN